MKIRPCEHGFLFNHQISDFLDLTMSETLKSKADASFKSLDFSEAATLYQKALETKDSNQIILNSNLSACYFEMGRHNFANK
jgi:tetratricopeptide (TPR) repeat protein